MHWDQDSINKLSACFNSKHVEPGSVVSIARVEFNYPVIDRPDVLQPVHMAMGWLASVREPSEQHSCDHQLILGIGVVLILLINGLPEVENAVGDAGEGATLQQVIDPGRERHV